MTRQKARDAALLLPFFGLLLLMPPFVGLFEGVAGLLSIPAVALYIFIVWAILIWAGFLLSRRLHTDPAPPPNAAGSPVPDDADA